MGKRTIRVGDMTRRQMYYLCNYMVGCENCPAEVMEGNRYICVLGYPHVMRNDYFNITAEFSDYDLNIGVLADPDAVLSGVFCEDEDLWFADERWG